MFLMGSFLGGILRNGTMSSEGKWDKWIAKVESVEFPDCPVQLDSAQRATSVRDLVVSHLKVVKRHNGNDLFSPYMKRLWFLYQLNKKGLLADSDKKEKPPES